MALQAGLRWRSDAPTTSDSGADSCAADSCARTSRGVGAIFALSSYLCERSPLLTELPAMQTTIPPIFLRHGDLDDFILTEWGEATAQQLRAKGADIDFATVKGARHELTIDELDDLSTWLLPRLGV